MQLASLWSCSLPLIVLIVDLIVDQAQPLSLQSVHVAYDRNYVTSPFVVQEVAKLSATYKPRFYGNPFGTSAESGSSQRVQQTEGSSRASEGELVPAIAVSAPTIGAAAR